ncbi:CHASE2 domain-containing protein [Telmatospirillum sp. J64-1]|uniref:CHASE2 domain-containing protein n=1 Tax=Telmatospirillum sp. J64-1 TaxID=2502183 RepID=UPI00272B83E0|nr:adenylate/guanylate cyclase domain-containing protein [Telmatospirillum sp. J64-1]
MKSRWASGAWWRGQFGGGRALALVLLGLMVWVRVADFEVLELSRAKTFDFYQKIKPRETPPDTPIAIVDIDEASLEEFGQWPWPRTVLADLLDKLRLSGAAVVGFDVIFPEEDRASPAAFAQTVAELDTDLAERLKTLPSNDEVFAQAIARMPVVLGQTGISDARRGRPDGRMISIAELGGDPRPWLTAYPSLLRNLPVLEEQAAGLGIFNTTAEIDGIVRRVPALVRVEERLYPSLAIEMLRVATGNQSLATRLDPVAGMQGLVVRPSTVRTDGHGRIWIYAAHSDHSKYISARDVLNGSMPPERVAGKMVLVGTSAAGLLDIRSTPLERNIPGVELHAQMIETIMFGTQLQQPADAAAVEIFAMLGVGLLMILLVPLVGARSTLVLFLVAASGIAGWSWYSFTTELKLYDPVLPILTSLVLYMMLTYAGYAREEAQRRQVRGAFSRYMSPALVERLAQHPEQLKLGGEMRDMTLLFADVRGFTTISEQFDAEGLTRFMNRFLTPMTDVILSRQGCIDKYMGDAIMAFWNAPLDDPDHAAHACEAALAMKARLEPLNRELEEEAKAEGRRHVPINIGIGLNSGEVCVGNMGSDQRFDYSVLGDTVNLASRLEGQSKPYGVTVVIGENTWERAPGYATLELDLIKVKGKTEAVRIYALLGDRAEAVTPGFQALEQAHEAMLAAYRAQNWGVARGLIPRCRELGGVYDLDGLYDLYEERIQAYEAAPPGAQWDGVFVATSK